MLSWYIIVIIIHSSHSSSKQLYAVVCHLPCHPKMPFLPILYIIQFHSSISHGLQNTLFSQLPWLPSPITWWGPYIQYIGHMSSSIFITCAYHFSPHSLYDWLFIIHFTILRVLSNLYKSQNSSLTLSHLGLNIFLRTLFWICLIYSSLRVRDQYIL